MINYDINDRFDILVIETAEEYLIRKKIEREKTEIEIEKFLANEELNGVCEGGCKGVRCREAQGVYTCYECFVYSLDCEGSVSVPRRSASNMRDYMEEYEWNEKWEEEHGFV